MPVRSASTAASTPARSRARCGAEPSSCWRSPHITGATHLVLGAWGAGVFGNDPEVVARAFAEPLRGAFAGVFDEVVFAVPDPSGANHRAFAAAFA